MLPGPLHPEASSANALCHSRQVALQLGLVASSKMCPHPCATVRCVHLLRLPYNYRLPYCFPCSPHTHTHTLSLSPSQDIWPQGRAIRIYTISSLSLGSFTLHALLSSILESPFAKIHPSNQLRIALDMLRRSSRI